MLYNTRHTVRSLLDRGQQRRKIGKDEIDVIRATNPIDTWPDVCRIQGPHQRLQFTVGLRHRDDGLLQRSQIAERKR